MSNNNNGHTTPEDYFEAAKRAIKLLTEATTGPYRLTEQDHGNTRYKQRVIRAAQNWRRRPTRNAPKWPEFDDVATLCGGESDQAKKNGELLAAAPELLKLLARGVLELQAASENDKVKPVLGQYRPTKETIDLYYFLANIASALDCLVEPDHRLGRNPFDALLGGTTEDRKNRAAILRSVADTIDPLNDDVRKRAKHPSERLNGTPTVQSFLEMMPDYVREHYNVELIHEADLMYAVEFDRLNLITQKKYQVDAWEVLVKFMHLHVMKVSERTEAQLDRTLSPGMREYLEEYDYLKRKREYIRPADEWLDEHNESITIRARQYMDDKGFWEVQLEEIRPKVLELLSARPSTGLLDDLVKSEPSQLDLSLLDDDNP